jgi:hypothetical protein
MKVNIPHLSQADRDSQNWSLGDFIYNTTISAFQRHNGISFITIAFPETLYNVITLVAGESISSGNVVYSDNGVAYNFDTTNNTLQGKVLGIARTSATISNYIDIYFEGIAEISGWGLTPNSIYYAGLTGNLSLTPTGTLSEMIGISLTSNKLQIKTLSIKTNGG